MADTRLKNIPENVLSELRQRAKHFRRDVEDEARSILMNSILAEQWRGDLTAEQLPNRARKVRENHPDAWMTEEFLRLVKNDGRL